MSSGTWRQEGRDGALSALNMAIEAMDLAREVSSITPAKAVFGTVCVLLKMIRDSMTNELEYVELGLSCANICKALDRGMSGRELDTLSPSVYGAITQLKTTVAEIYGKVAEQSERRRFYRFLHARNDKDKIAAWNSDLNRILYIFGIELAVNSHIVVTDIHQNILEARGSNDGKTLAIQNSVPGESPPPPPRVFFGREELIEKVVGLAERLTPIALIGVGGIGKTSIALTAIHNDRIKQRFGDNRWFIRCDKFPTSLTHFLCRLSKAVGTGIENPEDMTSLRPFLSSKEMFIILDNAESILDPQGANAQEIYEVVEELSRLDNICLCITSRIFTIPPNCETLDVPALSMGAAHDTFYRLYKRDEQSHSVDDILKQLDFHPLSVTLLAIVAHHSGWSTDRLTKEWGRQRTGLLQTEHNRSLAVTIELSLASPTFQELGPDARALLGVVAFFPQGINENNLSWLFPTIPNRVNIFDKFCTLSLTYRRDGSITMLAPLRDYFCPKDPMSSPLLLTTKDCYFHQLSADVDPDRPSSRELRWITSEDVNIEHLLDVFTTIDMSSRSVWSACASFMYHLYWHKPRLVVLESRVNGLPDNHPSKPRCLYHLSQLFGSVGNQVGRKQLLTHSLKLWRGWGDERWVARTLKLLSGANRRMGLYKEGILLAEEALDICERHGDTAGQAQCLGTLARLLYDDNQHDAAEEAISRAIDLLPEEGEKFEVCKCRRVLGNICRSKGKREKAISHFKVALGIASSCNWHDQLFWIHHSLAELFSKEGRFGIAYAHIERTKFHALNNAYYLGRAMKLQARILYTQRKLGEAKSEVLRAVEVFEKLKAVRDLESCRRLLRKIQTERSGRLR